jgi:hypothetical protein
MVFAIPEQTRMVGAGSWAPWFRSSEDGEIGVSAIVGVVLSEGARELTRPILE